MFRGFNYVSTLSRVSFLLVVKHSVAILSLVLVRETGDKQLLSVILFYVYISQNLKSTMYILK